MRRSRLGVLAASAATAAVLVAWTVAAIASPLSSASEPDAHPAASAPVEATPSPVSPLSAGGLQDPARDAEATAATDAEPTRLRIPAIGVDSALEDIGIDASGALAAPADYDRVGWFSAGVGPGQVGPAILAGHVDSPTGPAVFLRIGELVAGDEVLVELSSGATLTFEITGAQQSAKAAFPTSAVYSGVPRPELRLITCAGAFDRSIGHYTDNLIVYAALSG